jgi:AraC-like DNA-binding protein
MEGFLVKKEKKQDGFESEKLLVLPEYIMEEISTLPLIQPLYITDIGFFPKAMHHYRERDEGCDSYILIYCADGEGWVKFTGTTIIYVKKHMFIVIPAGTPHTYGASDHDPWSIYWFHFRGSEVKELVHTYGLNETPLLLPLSGYMKFVELFNHCYDTLVHKPYSKAHHINVSQTIKFLLSTLGLISVRTQQELQTEQYLEKALSYMNANIEQTITLVDLAHYVGLSKQHLTHLFNKETSFSPIDYFLRMKMNRAGQMLDLTDQTVKQIAISVGMHDPYYFSRLFKKIMGCSPSEYRNIKKG